MTAPARHIRPRHDLSPTEIDRLEDRLYEFNRRAVGRDDGAGLGFVALDASGAQIGAIAGYTWAGIAEIRQLWVDAPHRGAGLGRALLNAAMTEAARRGTSAVWVMSYDFQAPGFYERCGFERIASLPDWPPNHSHIALRRRLP